MALVDMKRPYTTLFLIESLDGKISTGVGTKRDVDKDYKTVEGIKDGIYQYYDLEQQTDLISLNSGKVMAKIGVNKRTEKPKKTDVSFVIIDNKPHLKVSGVKYLSGWVKTLYLVTSNRKHPVYDLNNLKNVEIISFEKKVGLKELMEKLLVGFGLERITIQSGGTLNAEWIRNGLIDEVSVVVAPLLVGGKDTPTLIDGKSLKTKKDISQIKTLRLIECRQLKNSFLHLRYKVNN